MGSKTSESEFYLVSDNLGITKNHIEQDLNGLRIVFDLFNVVEQHEPVNYLTSAGEVIGKTMTRRSDKDFPTMAAAEAFIRSLIA